MRPQIDSKCNNCGEQMIPLNKGVSLPFTYGEYTLYGCKFCGNVQVVFSQDVTDNNDIPKALHDPFDRQDTGLIN